jgi:transcriptional regulator with PAS, ATPase and Fis domain
MISIVNPDHDISLQLETLKGRFGADQLFIDDKLQEAKVIIYTNPKDIIERARQHPGAFHILLRENNNRRSTITLEDLKRNGMNSLVGVNDLHALVDEVEKGLKGNNKIEARTPEVVPSTSIQKPSSSVISTLGYPETFESVRAVLGELNPAADVKETIKTLSRKFDNGPLGVRTEFVKHAFKYLREHPETLKNGYNGHPAPELADKSFINIINRQPKFEFPESGRHVFTTQNWEQLLEAVKVSFPDAYIENNPKSPFPGKSIELGISEVTVLLIVKNNPQGVEFGYHVDSAMSEKAHYKLMEEMIASRDLKKAFNIAIEYCNINNITVVPDQVQGQELEPSRKDQEEYFQHLIDVQYAEGEKNKQMDALIQYAAEPMPLENKKVKIPYSFNPDVDLTDHINSITEDGKVQINGLVNNHIIGTSPAVVNMLFQLSRVIKFPQQDILVLGENGSGKDLVMKVIGENSFKYGTSLKEGSHKIAQPLEVINIGAESDELFRSALMGHEKGAFTDAKESRKGYLRSNANANLAIDEIGDVSLANQSTLLRVIQNREGIAVGADKPYNFDKRLIFATNKDLSNLRDDLRQRLSQGIIQVPPLRDRKEDIQLLTGFILNKANTDYPAEKKNISAGAVKLLNNAAMEWPGNVRELQTTVMRAFMMDVTSEISEKSILASIKASMYEPQTSKLKHNYQALESLEQKIEYEVVDQAPSHKEISHQMT